MNLTPEQQEALLSIARDIAAMGISVYSYSDHQEECLFCGVHYIDGSNETQDLSHHKADCTYFKACTLLKSLPEK